MKIAIVGAGLAGLTAAVDLVDAGLGDLVEMGAVEGRAGIAGAVQRLRGLAAVGVEGHQLLAGGGPDATDCRRSQTHVMMMMAKVMMMVPYSIHSWIH